MRARSNDPRKPPGSANNTEMRPPQSLEAHLNQHVGNNTECARARAAGSRVPATPLSRCAPALYCFRLFFHPEARRHVQLWRWRQPECREASRSAAGRGVARVRRQRLQGRRGGVLLLLLFLVLCVCDAGPAEADACGEGVPCGSGDLRSWPKDGRTMGSRCCSRSRGIRRAMFGHNMTSFGQIWAMLVNSGPMLAE